MVHLSSRTWIIYRAASPEDPSGLLRLDPLEQLFPPPCAAATRSIISPVAPAAMATCRACKDMCPRWMPSVARARSAARFWARPTETMTSASSEALCTIHQFEARPAPRDAHAWRRQRFPPPWASPVRRSGRRSRSRRHVESEVYRPIARCIRVRPGLDRPPVVAGGDHDCIHAVHDALVVRCGPVRICSGEGPGLDNAIAHGLTRVTPKMPGSARGCDRYERVRRRSARLLSMRRWTRPPVIASIRGARRSQAVFTALAPIASRTS